MNVLIVDRNPNRREKMLAAFIELDQVSAFSFDSITYEELSNLDISVILRHGSDEFPYPEIHGQIAVKICYGAYEGKHPGALPNELNIYRIIYEDQFLTKSEAQQIVDFAHGIRDKIPDLLAASLDLALLEEKLSFLLPMLNWENARDMSPHGLPAWAVEKNLHPYWDNIQSCITGVTDGRNDLKQYKYALQAFIEACELENDFTTT